jgi:hypothetical protein
MNKNKLNKLDQPSTISQQKSLIQSITDDDLLVLRDKSPAPVSLKDALQGIRPIGEAIKNYGLDVVRAKILMELFYVQRFYNVSRGLDQSQMIILTDLIIKTYSFFDIKELRFCFSEQMSYSKYGKVYERLDGSMIMDWLNQYYNERSDASEKCSLDEAHEYAKNDGKKVNTFDEYKKMLLERAKKGDKEAGQRLKDIDKSPMQRFSKRKEKKEVYKVNPKGISQLNKNDWDNRQEEYMNRKVNKK